MSLEKRVKERIDHNLDQMVKNPYEKKKPFPMWAKIAIPISSTVLTVGLVLGFISLPMTINRHNGFKDVTNQTHRLTTPKLEKVTKTQNRNMSSITYDSYCAFAKKFTSLMMEVNNKENEGSLGISIPDAYLCLAITGAISTDAARNDVLSYLELNNMDELRTSVKEIITTLGTRYENGDGKLVGGYNLNSVWFNPNKVSLIKEKDEQLYKDLEEVFDASLYLDALTSAQANNYLKKNGLKDMPVPKIKLNDDDPSAINAMSTYYCLDSFDEMTKQIYLEQFKSGKHKMDYVVNNNTSKVDYISQSNEGYVYEGDNFYGSTLSIGGALNMTYYLPNEQNAMPSTILSDVLNQNYHLKNSSYYDEDENKTKETNYHRVTINAPYFSLDNDPELKYENLSKVLPIITKYGAGERIATSNDGYPMYLDYIKQFSVMRFNYDGFYSCSVTISGIDTTSARRDPEYEEFNLILNHPYVFEVQKRVIVDDNYPTKNIPLVIGEIVEPNYQD